MPAIPKPTTDAAPFMSSSKRSADAGGAKPKNATLATHTRQSAFTACRRRRSISLLGFFRHAQQSRQGQTLRPEGSPTPGRVRLQWNVTACNGREAGQVTRAADLEPAFRPRLPMAGNSRYATQTTRWAEYGPKHDQRPLRVAL